MSLKDRLSLYAVAFLLMVLVCVVTYNLTPDTETININPYANIKGETMPNLNRIMLIGHVGQDPVTRYTQSGKAVTSFSLATNHSYKVGDEWKSIPEWHKIVCWEKQSQRASTFKKGDAIFVDGRLTYRKWEDNDGKPRTTPEIVASLVWKFEEAPPNRREERGYTPPPDDDDVPF